MPTRTRVLNPQFPTIQTTSEGLRAKGLTLRHSSRVLAFGGGAGFRFSDKEGVAGWRSLHGGLYNCSQSEAQRKQINPSITAKLPGQSQRTRRYLDEDDDARDSSSTRPSRPLFRIA